MPETLSRRSFLKGLGGGLLLAAGGWIYSAEIERRWVTVERVTVSLRRLPAAFRGLRLIILGDFHLGPYQTGNDVRAAVDTARGETADLILLTGDFVSSAEGYEGPVLAAELARLAAPLGVHAVLGNHDWWHAPEAVRQALRQSGINLLENSSTALNRAGAVLHLVGIDSCFSGHEDLPRAFAAVPPDETALVLAHEPDLADRVQADPRALLQISGHSHGGQVRLPGVGPLLLPRYGERYPQGLQLAGTLPVYTNRGIGVTKLPVRFNCPPEVTVLELQ